jgi:hypothetical protein
MKGDDHKFFLTKYNTLLNKIESYLTHDINSSYVYNLNLKPIEADENFNSFYELSIPTCSYRMGVNKMGYVSLVINQNGTVNIALLWTPQRFPSLYFYIYFIIILSLLKLCRIYL